MAACRWNTPGEDYQVAVTYPDDEQFELLSDPWVFQHEVETIAAL